MKDKLLMLYKNWTRVLVNRTLSIAMIYQRLASINWVNILGFPSIHLHSNSQKMSPKWVKKLVLGRPHDPPIKNIALLKKTPLDHTLQPISYWKLLFLPYSNIKIKCLPKILNIKNFTIKKYPYFCGGPFET